MKTVKTVDYSVYWQCSVNIQIPQKIHSIIMKYFVAEWTAEMRVQPWRQSICVVPLESDNLTGHSCLTRAWSKWHKELFKILFYFCRSKRSSLTSSYSYCKSLVHFLWLWPCQPLIESSVSVASLVLLFIRLTVIRPRAELYTSLSHSLLSSDQWSICQRFCELEHSLVNTL